MIELQHATSRDVPIFAAMEEDEGARDFVIGYGEQAHRRAMADPGVRYLRILHEGTLVGFIILALETRGSVELRRIVVSRRGLGIGKRAIALAEIFCLFGLGRFRIWLDVFEHNHRGRRFYESLGYTQFGESAHDGRRLLLYEKQL